MSPTKTATRGQLSRDVVVDRALAVADAEGLDAVTIRRLATELDVTPMALYWHFRTKEDLLGGTADRLLDAVAIPDGSGSWQHQLTCASTALVEAIRPHPQVAPLVKLRMLSHPSGLALTELALGALADAGFGTADASQIAWHALATAVLLVTGEPVDDSGASADERDAQLRQKSALIKMLPAEQYPHLVAAADDMTHCHDDDRFFTLGVDLFVAGVEGLAPTKVRPSRAPAAPRRRAGRTSARS
ncbi:MAG TPA: TetR/AcrR family transcriptional regulator C-terminal domain-containing protein [Mycobacteriales bacterium]